MKPPAIGSVVPVPVLHPLSPHRVDGKCFLDGQRGRVFELIETDGEGPADPLVCLEVEEEGARVFAWFLASDIIAGTVVDEEFCLSVDAMVSEYRPRRGAEGRVKVFFPETEEWFETSCYEATAGS